MREEESETEEEVTESEEVVSPQRERGKEMSQVHCRRRGRGSDRGRSRGRGKGRGKEKICSRACFGTGTAVDCFHSCGTQSERLQSLHTEGAMHPAVILSILVDIPSGPVVFETSNERS